MSAPIDLRYVTPILKREYEPPDDVDYSRVEDETLRELLMESSRRRDAHLQELYEQIVGAVNWAGQTRESGGWLYRYDDDADAWLSFARHAVFAYVAAPGLNGYPVDELGRTMSAAIGYWMPQDATVVRFWADWTNACPVGFTINVAGGGSWTSTAGTETSQVVDVHGALNAGQVLWFSWGGNAGSVVTNLAFGAEIAWRTTVSG